MKKRERGVKKEREGVPCIFLLVNNIIHDGYTLVVSIYVHTCVLVLKYARGVKIKNVVCLSIVMKWSEKQTNVFPEIISLKIYIV